MEARERIRGVGMRATRPRIAVWDALALAGAHSDVEEIAEIARREGPISTQAVYDTLGSFARRGLVRRIEPAGHPARYELRAGDNHHHLVCRRCGRTEDVDCTVGHAPCLVPSDAAGFAIDEAEVVFWGLCPACQSAT